MDNTNKPHEEVADFSGYMKKPESVSSGIQNTSPIQEYKRAITFTKRLKYLVLFLAILAVSQVVLIMLTQKPAASTLPEGYRLVTPQGQPAYIEPIK